MRHPVACGVCVAGGRLVAAERHHLGETEPDAGIVTDRPTKSHEYLFLLTKSSSYFYDAEAIKEEVRYFRRTDSANRSASKSETA